MIEVKRPITKIKFSSGKEIELTEEEFKELAEMSEKQHDLSNGEKTPWRFIPYPIDVDRWWLKYYPNQYPTITCRTL